MNDRNKLTYEAFLNRVSERTGGRVADVDRFLHQIGPAVETTLERDGTASLAGFGSFNLREIAERPGHNPRTNATTTVDAHTHVHFSPFRALKWSVNRPYRLLGIRLFAREEDQARTRRWRMVAIPVLLLALIGLAGWLMWWMQAPSATQQANDAASVAAPASQGVATESQATPKAAAPAKAGAPAAPAPSYAFPVQTHVALRGDNFWDLAGKLWGDTAWWPLLYVANREDLPVAHPDQLPLSTRLQVPALEGGPAAPSADDLERLTAAYGVVGKDYRRANNARAADYVRVGNRGFPAN